MAPIVLYSRVLLDVFGVHTINKARLRAYNSYRCIYDHISNNPGSFSSMNTASSRNDPSILVSSWEHHYDHYDSYREEPTTASFDEVRTMKQASASQSHMKNAPSKYPKLERDEDEKELRKYLNSSASRARDPAFVMLSYPSNWEIERIIIPDSNELFLSSLSAPEQPSAASRSDRWMQEEKRAYSNSQSSSASTPGFHAVTGPAHILAMQQQDRKYREPPAAQRDQSKMEMEVGPGVYMSLHCSEETRQAARDGLLTSCPCYNCDQSLRCIAIALYVICPHCREISPIFESQSSSSTAGGGIGLGISESEYLTWQDEEELQYYRQQQSRNNARSSSYESEQFHDRAPMRQFQDQDHDRRDDEYYRSGY
jgi:hypothetical protein